MYSCDIDTASVQSVIITNYNLTGYFTVNCTLLPGATGCRIKTLNETGYLIFTQTIYAITGANIAAANSSQKLTNGTYTVEVYTLESYKVTIQQILVILQVDITNNTSNSSDDNCKLFKNIITFYIIIGTLYDNIHDIDCILQDIRLPSNIV